MKTEQRIALCLSGQPRSFAEAFPYIKKNIIDCNDNIDVFLHCWYDPEKAGQVFTETSDTVREEGKNIIEASTPDKLVALYKPVAISCEPQQDFSHLIKPEYQAASDKTNPFATFSMWTSIQRCNDLKKLHEEKNAFIYDVVIKGRFDLKLETPIRIRKPEKSSLYTSGYNNNQELVEDILFYGSSDTIDMIAELPNKLDEHFHRVNVWNNERLLQTHCIENKIKIIRFRDWKFTLIRGKRTLLDTLWYYKNRIYSKLHL